jgi:hypothetical protein
MSKLQRRYRTPDGFRSHEHLVDLFEHWLEQAGSLCAVSGLSVEDASAAVPDEALSGNITSSAALVDATRIKVQLAHAMDRQDWPFVWVGEDMTEALRHCDLPPQFNVQEMLWPRMALAFLFPTGSIGPRFDDTFTEDDGIAGLVITLVRSGDTFDDATRGIRMRAADDDEILLAVLVHNRKTGLQTCYQSRKRLSVFALDASERDVWGYALNAILIMTEVPELLEPARMLERRPGKGGAAPVEWWAPFWLGRTYVTVRPQREPGDGTHASPRLHWRRGHWTRQVFGVGRAERKRIWIRPLLVNAGERDE